MAKAVLITGGTGALGGAVTRRFLEDGHNVAVTWRVEEEVAALRKELGRFSDRLLSVEADVTDTESIDKAIETVAEGIGPIEVLIHLVGSWTGGEPIHEHSVEAWDRMMELNLRSAFLCCRAVLPTMYEGGWGRIVLVSSRAARVDREGQGAYAVAKAGVSVLAETIAEEASGTNVTANAVAPSTLDTPANRAAMPEANHSGWVPPADVAAAIAFLASEEAGQLRGAGLPVFGSA